MVPAHRSLCCQVGTEPNRGLQRAVLALGTTRSRHRFLSEEIYFAMSKIDRFAVLHCGFKCERSDVFCEHSSNLFVIACNSLSRSLIASIMLFDDCPSAIAFTSRASSTSSCCFLCRIRSSSAITRCSVLNAAPWHELFFPNPDYSRVARDLLKIPSKPREQMPHDDFLRGNLRFVGLQAGRAISA